MQEEKRFLRGLKERQEADMKVFINQQKSDLRSTKSLYKKVCFIVYITAAPLSSTTLEIYVLLEKCPDFRVC